MIDPNIYAGHINTDDEDLNRIIRAVETETGATLASAIPAITYDEDPDTKIYLVLLTVYSDAEIEEETRDWQILTGRQNAYDFLRNLIKLEAIDPNRSFILSGTQEFDETFNKDNVSFEGKPITVFRFMKVMLDNHKVLDDQADFDINEYDPGNYEHGDLTIME